jgi:hypothetical protein
LCGRTTGQYATVRNGGELGDELLAVLQVVGTDHELGVPKGRVRAAMTAELLAAADAGRARIAIGRASDFFGPGVTEGSTLGERVFGNAPAGRSADFIGNPGLPQTSSYVPTFWHFRHESRVTSPPIWLQDLMLPPLWALARTFGVPLLRPLGQPDHGTR